MKCVAVAVILVFIGVGAGLKERDDIINECKMGPVPAPTNECKDGTEGPYCFSYSKPDATGEDPCDQPGTYTTSPTCPVLGYFQKVKNGNLKVKLIGQISGGSSYVGIVFGPGIGNFTKLGQDAKFGVICRSDKQEIVVVKPPITESGTLALDTTKAVIAGTSKSDKDWVVCEFELNSAVLDLSKDPYRVGLMIGKVTGDNIQGGPLTYNQQALDVFSKLKPAKVAPKLKTDGGKPDGGSGAAQLAAAMTLVAFSLIL